MKGLLISCLLVSVVFCRPQHFNDDFNLSPDQYQQILEAKTLTDKLKISKEEFVFNESILQYNENDISFYIYTREDTKGSQVHFNQSDKLTSLSSFNTAYPSVFIIHGWTNNYDSAVEVVLTDGLLNIGDFNVFCADWDKYANQLYVESVLSVPNVGKTIGQFIKSMSTLYNYPAEQVTIMGHSLGAHIAGIAGKETNGSIRAILGMDPAGPLFFKENPDGRLNKGDAQYVEAVHTNAILLGVDYNVGDIDFWPNGGYGQPGCEVDPFGECCHGRSYKYVAESLYNNEFYARECDSLVNYKSGKCANNTKALMGGIDFDTTISGHFYLETNSATPFGLGDVVWRG